ncbi:GtrA family protein [Hyphomonas pacifica]|uniref:GtrA family protein n=1 Tax=Hyphomonas pacifica TaxID=1280941 RepID=UPI000DD47442|nr:GtrA family protein [Hyphomonas pacifica]
MAGTIANRKLMSWPETEASPMNKKLKVPSARSSGLRYLVANLCALGVDYLLTLSLFHFADADLSFAAGVSFILVGFLFYFVHEFWTFKSADSRFSRQRLIGNLTVLLVAGAVRVLLIFVLESWKAPIGILATIYFGIGVAGSFVTNFMLNRFFVFRR